MVGLGMLVSPRHQGCTIAGVKAPNAADPNGLDQSGPTKSGPIGQEQGRPNMAGPGPQFRPRASPCASLLDIARTFFNPSHV